MTDKEKIIAHIEKLLEKYPKNYHLTVLWDYIESLPKEPVSKVYTFKSIPRLLDMIQPSDRAKTYIAKLADSLEEQGYHTDAKIVRESIKIMNGEKVAMATMDEEPVSDDLEEASKEWLISQLDKSYAAYGETKQMELTHFDGYAMLDAIEFGAKWQKQQDSIPTKDLEELISTLSKRYPEVSFAKLSRIAVRVAKWQREQFEKNRLKHCNSITNEQAELEQGFIDQHLDKHQRMPTFLDAIEYGIRLQKEQIMEALLSEVLPHFMHGGEADEVVAKLDEVLNKKK